MIFGLKNSYVQNLLRELCPKTFKGVFPIDLIPNLYSKNTSFFYNRDQSSQYFREKENKPKLRVKYKYDNKTKGKMLINFFDSILSNKNRLIISEDEQFYLMKICLMLVQSQLKKKIIKL